MLLWQVELSSYANTLNTMEISCRLQKRYYRRRKKLRLRRATLKVNTVFACLVRVISPTCA